MPLTRARRRTGERALLGILTTALAGSSPARAEGEKAACVAASDQAQTLRDDGKYREARAAMTACAREVCPGIVRRDCEKMLSDLDAAQPTLVLGARDPKGDDVAGTRVLLDGAPLLDRLEGKPVAVDPGEHVFRYEAPGVAPVEQRVVVRVNEKNRVLTAILMPSSAVDPPRPAPSLVVEAPPRRDSARAPVPPGAWVLGGVAVVGAGSFAFFGLSGQGDVSTLRATCAPNCAESQVDAARTKLIVADVSLGVGVVSLAAAAWIFFHRGARHDVAAGILPDVEARPGGAVATLRARF